MSCSCVLMRIKLCRHFLLFISVFSELSDYAATKPYIDDNGIQLSTDFMKFVKDMGRIVYSRGEDKPVRQIVRHPIVRRPLITSTIRNMITARREVNKLNTQKAALRDVLMMKLVSYYEDKYKLTDPKTTPSTARTNNFILAGGNRRRYEPMRFNTESTPVPKKDGVAEVLVI